VADFCRDCTAELYEGFEDQNDFAGIAGEGDYIVTLCESCGVHAFDHRGQRACQRPQSDFFDGHDRTPSWPDLCESCAALVAK